MKQMLRDILSPKVGQEIGSNLERPRDVEAVTLVAVARDHFTVQRLGDPTRRHFPLAAIAEIQENPDGIHYKRDFFHREKVFKMIVRIGHVVEQVVVA